MAEDRGTKIARALLEWTGNNPRRYVPGSAVMSGRTLTWTEQCKSICRHDGGGCHSARVGSLPSGEVDPIASPAPARAVEDVPLPERPTLPGVLGPGEAER